MAFRSRGRQGPSCNAAAQASACCRYAVMTGVRDATTLVGIAPAPAMLPEQQGAAHQVGAGSVSRRFGQHLNGVAARIDREQAEPQQAAQLVDAAVPVPPPARRSDRQPDFVRRRQTVDGLQDQFEGEAHLQLGDDEEGPLAWPDRHDVAATDLALGLIAKVLQMRLHCRVEGGLETAPGHGGQPTTLALDGRCPGTWSWRLWPGGAPLSHSPSLDQRRRALPFLTAIASARRCPTSTTSRLPRVTPV